MGSAAFAFQNSVQALQVTVFFLITGKIDILQLKVAFKLFDDSVISNGNVQIPADLVPMVQLLRRDLKFKFELTATLLIERIEDIECFLRVQEAMKFV